MFLTGIPKGEHSAGMPFPLEGQFLSVSTVLLITTVFVTLISYFVLRRYKRAALLPILGSWGFMGIVYALSLKDIRYFVARYLLVAAYFLCLLMGTWLAERSRKQVVVAIGIYFLFLAQLIPVNNSQGYNQLRADLDQYTGKHFYALNSFDYLIAKYYFGEERVRLYNVGWPQYDSRSWPGIGMKTQRVEDLNIVRQDDQGIILWNTELPLERRDDRAFAAESFFPLRSYAKLQLYTNTSTTP